MVEAGGDVTDGSGVQTAPSEDRILTIPNAVTLVRLLLLPVFVYLLFGRDDRLAAGWLLVGIGATDWVDGYLARRLQQVSNVGKILDPVADRLLFFVGVGSILIDGSVPVWIAVLVLVREVAIAIATVALAAAGARRIDVTWIGKCATFLLMGVFPGFLLSNADTTLADVYGAMAWAAAIPGLLLSYYSLAMYLPLGRKALAEGRADRALAAQTSPSTDG
ncbi:CDP-alcohol phosphatidyltransferase family protein [Actinospongicola halichondriae]|uniref:CDP-alcohol phosphatidyltransferase family protein n=1 Tax=Actinospongicola halichondriae TaxID=3236844 RepID=UPI003D4D6442